MRDSERADLSSKNSRTKKMGEGGMARPTMLYDGQGFTRDIIPMQRCDAQCVSASLRSPSTELLAGANPDLFWSSSGVIFALSSSSLTMRIWLLERL